MKYFLLGLLLIATPYSYAADGGSVPVETPAASHKAVLIKSGKDISAISKYLAAANILTSILK
jgi:hypothetical protein